MSSSLFLAFELHQNPSNPNLSINSFAQFNNPQSSFYPNFSSIPSHPIQNPNTPNPQPSLGHFGVPSTHLGSSLQPPGVDSYATLNSLQTLAGYEAQVAALYQQQLQNWAAGTFFQDPNANGTKTVVPASINPTPSIARPYFKGLKKTKIVPSAYCEVCKIGCNSRDVYEKHISGKKHLFNLQRIEEARLNPHLPTPVPAPAPAPIAKLQIGPSEKPFQKKPEEDLETKKRKLMEGGAAGGAVRMCTICNVACNSQTVFNFHLTGQKHALMVQKLASGT